MSVVLKIKVIPLYQMEMVGTNNNYLNVGYEESWMVLQYDLLEESSLKENFYVFVGLVIWL